jgi:hypothetical protein
MNMDRALSDWADAVLRMAVPARVGAHPWRAVRWWAIGFAAIFLVRTAFDWLLPAVDFHARSLASTMAGVGMLLMASFWAARRAQAIYVGPLFNLAVVLAAAPISMLGAAALLAVQHDRATLAAIQGSGGLGEAFLLPWLMVVPALVLGAVGGAAGAAAEWSRTH